jgi:hypothetical protein
MSGLLDNLIAFRILYMLVVPFEKTDAFKLGIIDKDGNQLKKRKDFTNTKEKAAYTNLHKLVFNLKKLLAKIPGGGSRLGTLAAAYWLIKEARQTKNYNINESYSMSVLTSGVCLVEEELLVEKFLKEDVDAGSIPNVTGHAVSTDEPVISGKVETPFFRRLKKKLKEVK